MLVLTRKPSESVLLTCRCGCACWIVAEPLRPNKTKLIFDADPRIRIVREELIGVRKVDKREPEPMAVA